MSKSFIYLPILKWRMGEYQALHRLKTHIKNSILPLIIVPPVEYDFEEKCPKKTVQEHIELFANRYSEKWGERNSLIDLHESLEEAVMDSGVLVVTHIFNNLRSASLNAVPVVRISHSIDFLNALKIIASLDERGAAIRIKFNDLLDQDLNINIKRLVSHLSLNYKDVDLIIDLEVPQSFEPYIEFAKAIAARIKNITQISDFRSFSIAGMSLDLSKIRKPGGEPKRHEWFLYQNLLKELSNTRKPTYGDYTIEKPEFISLDMRLLNPAGKIVYTTDNTWFISKGGSFRNNVEQMNKHCKNIIDSGHYYGESFSAGDKRIYSTYNKIEGTGNQTTWKQVGISHHITLVVEQLSKFHAP